MTSDDHMAAIRASHTRYTGDCEWCGAGWECDAAYLLSALPTNEALTRALRAMGLMEEPLPGTSVEQFAAELRAALERGP